MNKETSMQEKVKHKAPENAFHDLSKNSAIFRQNIIQEFQVLDNVNDLFNVSAPIHSSRDFYTDSKLRTKILTENPFQLIKFPAYKRTRINPEELKDRRFTRAKNVDSLPIGVWAAWLVENAIFQWAFLFLILVNVILIGVDAELSFHPDDFYIFFDFYTCFNWVVCLILYVEVALKVIDNPNHYLSDGWKMADLLMTVISTIPELFQYLPNSNSLKVLRLARIFKLVFRSATMRVIILTILQAFKSMGLIMSFVFIVSYCYAIVSVYLFEDYTKSTDNKVAYRDYFSSFGSALLSLFQMLTLDQWDHINKDVRIYSDPVWTQVYIISWVWLGAFIFRGIFVGVMVQNFDRISDSIKQQREAQIKLKKLNRLRQKLNLELNVQNNIQKSIDDLSSTADNLLSSQQNLSNSSLSVNSTQQAQNEQLKTAKLENMLKDIQELLKESHGSSRAWESTLAETLLSLSLSHTETNWAKDSLFKYFQLMENLQENMREYQELQLLATRTLLELHDT